MGLRVALLSGGKDSFYAATRFWPPDLGVVLVYRFPEPSPHLVNLQKTIETITATGIPVVVARLPKGREMQSTVELLRRLGADEVIAGDVYIQDHLDYMERVAREAGATLREPLWGRDPVELLYEIVEYGIESVITGVRGIPTRLLGRRINKDSVDDIVEEAGRGGWDPLGERGEYHTLLVNSPHHQEAINYSICGLVAEGSVSILRLC